MRASHFTLNANTVRTVTLAADASEIEVCNVDGAAAIYFTVDGGTPTVRGDDTYVLPAAIGSLRVPAPTGSGATTVRLISAGAPQVSVADISAP